MKAPKVDRSINQTDAVSQLQMALDHIAEIYTIIGDLPYHVTKDQNWKPLVEIYDDGDRKLRDLATDPIPF